MLVYYQGFGAGNQYDLSLYPQTANTLRQKLRRANFLSEAEYNAGTLAAAAAQGKPAEDTPGAHADPPSSHRNPPAASTE